MAWQQLPNILDRILAKAARDAGLTPEQVARVNAEIAADEQVRREIWRQQLEQRKARIKRSHQVYRPLICG